jgi:glycosyltransferase involved in cell wall biosynthesis
VERFSNSVVRALQPDWEIQFVEATLTAPLYARRVGAGYMWNSRASSRALRSVPANELVITNGFLGWGIPRHIRRIHVFHGTTPGAMRATRGARLHDRVRRAVGGGLAELFSARGAYTVAVSEATAEEVARLYRIHVDRIIENGVDVERFRPRDRVQARMRLGLPAEKKLALFVGTPELRKGIDLAEKAAARTGYTLLVAGRYASPGSQYLGLLTEDQLCWAYAAADCVLLPSRYEACSYAVLESLAAGVPLVTTPVGWTRNLVQRVPAYRSMIVEPTLDAVSTALSRCREPDTSDAVSQARELIASHNSLNAFADRWRRLCEEVLTC